MNENAKNTLTQLQDWLNTDSVNLGLLSQVEIDLYNYIEFVKKFEFHNYINLKSNSINNALNKLKVITEQVTQINKAYENLLYYIEILNEELA